VVTDVSGNAQGLQVPASLSFEKRALDGLRTPEDTRIAARAKMIKGKV